MTYWTNAGLPVQAQLISSLLGSDKESAYCRGGEERGEHMRSGSMCARVLGRLWKVDVGATRWRLRAQGAGLRLDAVGWGAREGGEKRAAKMCLMSVTLDVSNFSGWSNDIAPCMVKRRREAVRGIRMPEGVAGYRSSGNGVRSSTHRKHLVHVCDAGCVEAQRVVERDSVL